MGLLMNICPFTTIQPNYNEIIYICKKLANRFSYKYGEGDLVVMDIQTFKCRK